MKVHAALLGTLPRSQMCGNFWDHVHSGIRPKIDFFAYRPLQVNASNSTRPEYLFGCNDAPHTQKCAVRQLRSHQRKFHLGATWVDTSGLLQNGIPVGALFGRDLQSDKDHAMILSPGYLRRARWLDPGLSAFQYLASCLTSVWLASDLFSASELLEVSLTAYYVLLACVAKSWHERGAHWEKNCMSKTTVRLLLGSAGHLALRCVYWPRSIPFSPSRTQEDACERHFAAVKRPYTGTPTVKDALYSTQLVHANHFKSMRNGLKDKHKARLPTASPCFQASRFPVCL